MSTEPNAAQRLRPLSSVAALAVIIAACSSPGGAGGQTAPQPDGVIFGDSGVGDAQGTTGCSSDAQCPAEQPHCAPTGICLECVADGHCGAGRCVNGVCAAASCTPGETSCNGNTLLTCRADGSGWDTFVCTGGTCAEGACQGCLASSRVCNGASIMQCRADGSSYDIVEVCDGDDICADGRCLGCYPGTRRCGAAAAAEICSLEGVWGPYEDCGAMGMSCVQGTCVSPCISDLKSKSNSGCDYWALDLDNHYAAQDGPFAVIVSNLSDDPATITVSKKDSAAAATEEVARRVVQPDSLEIFDLPQRHMAGAGVFWKAYRVQSTAPIVAYQFNPLDNVDVFSNDASILLPANTYGTEYIVVSRFEIIGGGPGDQPIPYRGTISVVAPNPETDVTITPTTRTLAGNNMQTMVAGQSYTYVLGPYQVLNIKSDQDGGDLTGTIITATSDIAVFAGHEAAVSSTTCCADHLEQQMLPVVTWGKTYVASKSFPRLNEKDYWRIVAAEAETSVSFLPAVHPTTVLGRGEFLEFQSDEDFVITSSKPVTVAQTLASSGEVVDPPALAECVTDNDCYFTYTCQLPAGAFFGEPKRCFPQACQTQGGGGCLPGHVCTCFDLFNCVCSATGDPALIVHPPTEQFRNDYVFLTPDKYTEDFINIVAPSAAAVVLDGVTLPSGNFTAVPGSDWKIARLKVTDGVHKLTANQPVGVISYGYDRDVSYGYAAGMNLEATDD